MVPLIASYQTLKTDMPAAPQRFLRILRSPSPVPPELRQVFFHLYMEIGWFGFVSGATLSFLAVYATRQGANPWQIGLLSSVPALVNLVFSLPAGNWLGKRPIGQAVFWTSIASRIFYLVLVPLPILLAPQTQVWTIILLSLLMTIPGTALTVGFNSLFGEAVPGEWRGHVVGIRNAIVSIVSTAATLISGQILVHIAFPYGYVVVFGIGFLGAALSSLHLYFLARLIGKGQDCLSEVPRACSRAVHRVRVPVQHLYQRSLQTLRLDIMRGPFARIMGLLFAWHTAQFLSIPIITPFVVNQLHVNDQFISLGNGLFNITMFLGSLRLNHATRRFGNRKLTALGVMGLSLFPSLTALGSGGYLTGSFIGGLAFAMATGALYNYILENCPGADRPAYLAWYSLVSNGAILVGSTLGPAIAEWMGFPAALILFGIARLLAGAAILRWG